MFSSFLCQLELSIERSTTTFVVWVCSFESSPLVQLCRRHGFKVSDGLRFENFFCENAREYKKKQLDLFLISAKAH